LRLAFSDRRRRRGKADAAPEFYDTILHIFCKFRLFLICGLLFAKKYFTIP